MQALPPNGAMVSVLATEQQLNQIMASWKEQMTIAAFNGPESLVLSGPEEAISDLIKRLKQAEIKATQLKVCHGFHSPLMEPMIAEFANIAETITYHQPQLPIISNISGQLATEVIASPEYWCAHIRLPVQFLAGMKSLHQLGCDIFIECGGKSTLLGMGRACLPEATGGRRSRKENSFSRS